MHFINDTNNQFINRLFTFFDSLDTAVFWACTADYKKILYINKTYERIFGQTMETLRKNPKLCFNTLLNNNFENYIDSNRSTDREIHSIVYRIRKPDGKIVYLKNTNYTLVDTKNIPILISGVGEILTEKVWKIYNETFSSQLQITSLLKELCEIISKNEFKLSCHSLKLKKKLEFNKNLKNIRIDNRDIKISEQEARCVNYLLKGKSAKETAEGMKISVRTVEAHLNNLRRKTSCRSKLELICKIKNSVHF